MNSGVTLALIVVFMALGAPYVWAQPEGAFFNFINWIGNVVAPVWSGRRRVRIDRCVHVRSPYGAMAHRSSRTARSVRRDTASRILGPAGNRRSVVIEGVSGSWDSGDALAGSRACGWRIAKTLTKQEICQDLIAQGDPAFRNPLRLSRLHDCSNPRSSVSCRVFARRERTLTLGTRKQQFMELRDCGRVNQ